MTSYVLLPFSLPSDRQNMSQFIFTIQSITVLTKVPATIAAGHTVELKSRRGAKVEMQLERSSSWLTSAAYIQLSSKIRSRCMQQI